MNKDEILKKLDELKADIEGGGEWPKFTQLNDEAYEYSSAEAGRLTGGGEQEVERLEVFVSEIDKMLSYESLDAEEDLHNAVDDPCFIAYEYQDGTRSSQPRLCSDDDRAEVPVAVLLRRVE